MLIVVFKALRCLNRKQEAEAYQASETWLWHRLLSRFD